MALCTHTRTQCGGSEVHLSGIIWRISWTLMHCETREKWGKLLQGTQVWGHVQLLCRQQASCTDLLAAAPLCSSSAHFLKCPLPTHTVTWQISEVCIPCSSHKSSCSHVILGQILYILWLSNSARGDTALADTYYYEVFGKIVLIRSPKQCPSCIQPGENQIVVEMLPWTVICFQQSPSTHTKNWAVFWRISSLITHSSTLSWLFSVIRPEKQSTARFSHRRHQWVPSSS